jgi:hypothetical protein
MLPVVHKLGVIRSCLSTSMFKSVLVEQLKMHAQGLHRIVVTVNTNQDARILQLPLCLSYLNHNLSAATSKSIC